MKTLDHVDEFLDRTGSPLRREPESLNRFHNETFGSCRLGTLNESAAEHTVDRLLHGFNGTPVLLVKESGNVIVDGQSCAHIMMLSKEAS
ncbi:MAG: hypothetical protein ABI147_14260 [Acidobacteriaceae bacterium]